MDTRPKCVNCNAVGKKLGRGDELNTEGIWRSFRLYWCAVCNANFDVPLEEEFFDGEPAKCVPLWPRHCPACMLVYFLETFCTQCAEGLEFGNLLEVVEKEKIYTDVHCGYCGRTFKIGELFCGKCQTSREEAIKIDFFAYLKK